MVFWTAISSCSSVVGEFLVTSSAKLDLVDQYCPLFRAAGNIVENNCEFQKLLFYGPIGFQWDRDLLPFFRDVFDYVSVLSTLFVFYLDLDPTGKAGFGITPDLEIKNSVI